MSFSPRNGESVLKNAKQYFLSMSAMFQSPQWGKCSKVLCGTRRVYGNECFSPRNGESVLKPAEIVWHFRAHGFSPRNGESVLKLDI